MKRITRVKGKYQRRYQNKGILMYRERENLVVVPAGALVNVIGPAAGGGQLCQYNDVFVRIPDENLTSTRTARPPQATTVRRRQTVEA